MVSDRLKRFEAWSATREVDVRRPELSRVAAELLELAGEGNLLDADVEALVRRYKQGLLGAQRVLAAQRVGELMLQWQDEELNPQPLPAVEALAPPPAFDAMLEPTPSLDGPKSVVPGPKVSTWARQPGAESHRPAPLYEGEAELGHDWSVPENAAALASSSSRPPAREVSFSEIDPAARDASASLEAPARNDRPSQLPAALGPIPAELEVARGSVRPRARGSEAPPPSHVDHVAASKSSRPPPGLDPGLASLSGVGLMVAPGSISSRERVPLPPPVTSYPIGALAAANLTPDKRIDGSGAKMWGGIGFALLIGIAVTIVVTKPSCMFADPGRPVTGPFVDKYLGLKLNFPERWLYGEDLDDKEKDAQGYTRRISVFYQGTSATDYAAKLEVITFMKDGETPSEEIAANRGAGETIDQARNRSCNPIVRGTVRGTRCVSISQQLGSPAPYSTVEYYFPLASYSVFARGRVKIPSIMSGGGPGALPQENKEVMDRLDQIEDIIDSIDIAR